MSLHPLLYIEQGLNKKWLGATFAVLITISFGFVFNAVQANTVATAFNKDVYKRQLHYIYNFSTFSFIFSHYTLFFTIHN